MEFAVIIILVLILALLASHLTNLYLQEKQLEAMRKSQNAVPKTGEVRVIYVLPNRGLDRSNLIATGGNGGYTGECTHYEGGETCITWGIGGYGSNFSNVYITDALYTGEALRCSSCNKTTEGRFCVHNEGNPVFVGVGMCPTKNDSGSLDEKEGD